MAPIYVKIAVSLALVTILGSCAAHQPAPATAPVPGSPSRAAGASDPLGLAGQILTMRRRPGHAAHTVAAFAAEARGLQTERISSNPVVEGADQSWNVYFAAFLAGVPTKGDAHIQLVDLTGGKREHVADGGWTVDAPVTGVRALYGAVQLAAPWFVGDRRYEMTIDVDRVATASTTFWLSNEPASAAPPPTDATPAQQSPDVANGSPRGDGADVLERARRAPGSLACVPAQAPGAGVLSKAEGIHSSPGLRITSPDKETIKQIIRRHVPAVRACYERTLADLPNLQGRMLSRFVIGPEGGVRGSCAVESDLKNATLEACILDEVGTMKFPESINEGWVVVAYPFVLRPADDDEPARPDQARRPRVKR
jgi:hypothetical protein